MAKISKFMVSISFPGLLLVTNCTSTAPVSHDVHTETPIKGDALLTVEDRSTDGTINFIIRGGDTVFTDYGISHTKEMHLIVVRNDLEHFQHLHPQRNEEGAWSVPFAFPEPGTYWLYADFVDQSGAAHTLRFERIISSDAEAVSFQPHPATPAKDPSGSNAEEKLVDGYRIQTSSLASADGVQFWYYVLDAEGRQVPLQTYLGEKGHRVLLSTEGDFVHTHPHKDYAGYSESDAPVFFVPRSALKDAQYRIFTQFQINGEIVTVDFDWLPSENGLIL